MGSEEGKEPRNWFADSVNTEMGAAWDAAWLPGITMWHGVTPVWRGVRYSLCAFVCCATSTGSEARNICAPTCRQAPGWGLHSDLIKKSYCQPFLSQATPKAQ